MVAAAAAAADKKSIINQNDFSMDKILLSKFESQNKS